MKLDKKRAKDPTNVKRETSLVCEAEGIDKIQ